MRHLIGPAFVSMLLGACASTPIQDTEAGKNDAASVDPKPAEGEKEKRGFLTHALLYLPNRVLDIFDPVRFGVQVGPGLGFDVAATEYAQAQFWNTFSVGVGFQSLRALPIQVGGETGLGAGPVGGIVGSPLPWSRTDSSVRLGLHVLLVGGHVSIDPVELLDIPLGFFFIDINDDDI